MGATTIFGVGIAVMYLCYAQARKSKTFSVIAGTLTVFLIVAIGIAHLVPVLRAPASTPVSTPPPQTTNAAPSQQPVKSPNVPTKVIISPKSFGKGSPSVGVMTGNSEINYGTSPEKDAGSDKESKK
jgi:hypothetical protein